MSGTHTPDRQEQASHKPQWWQVVAFVALTLLAAAVSLDLFW